MNKSDLTRLIKRVNGGGKTTLHETLLLEKKKKRRNLLRWCCDNLKGGLGVGQWCCRGASIGASIQGPGGGEMTPEKWAQMERKIEGMMNSGEYGDPRPIEPKGNLKAEPVDEMSRIKARALNEADLKRLIKKVVKEQDFNLEGDEPVTKSDLNKAVNHIISTLKDAVDVGSYGDWIK